MNNNLKNNLNKQIIEQPYLCNKLAYYIDSMKYNGKSLNPFTILVIGKTGSGKSHTAKVIEKQVEDMKITVGNKRLNIVKITATGITKEGYVGKSITKEEEMMKKIEKVRRNFVILDEIDKLLLDDNTFKSDASNDLLDMVNDNPCIMLGSFQKLLGNSNKYDVGKIMTIIKGVNTELHNRIHDVIVLEDVDNNKVIDEAIEKISNTYNIKTAELQYLYKLLEVEDLSYRYLSTIFYKVGYSIENGIKDEEKILKSIIDHEPLK